MWYDDDRRNAIDVLWDRARKEGLAGVRDALIVGLLPLAKAIAARIYRNGPISGTDFQDYLQWARVGLIESIDRFDLGRGIPFEGFAVRRIRGAILNGLGSANEVAAQRRAWRERVAARVESLRTTAAEPKAGWEIEVLSDIVASIAIGFLLDGEADEASDDTSSSNPYRSAELDETRSALLRLMPLLPPRDQMLLRRHYFDGEEFKEIAADWGITKGRMSQLHTQSLQRLRELFRKDATDYERRF